MIKTGGQLNGAACIVTAGASSSPTARKLQGGSGFPPISVLGGGHGADHGPLTWRQTHSL
jgi:hypothetical protein